LETGFKVGNEGIYLWPLMDADRYVAAMNANPRRWEDVVMNPQPWVSNGSANYEVAYCADLQQAPYAQTFI
ncbi:MAG: hypothetical protein IIZ32_01585, partial [Ruminococcus sp.]|nr:hypothetical protein [Ruminococcus sp.]